MRYTIQNTGYQDAPGTHWILQQHKKKTQAAMKVTLCEIKENPQETNSEEKEVGIQNNDLQHEEEVIIQPEHNEETRIQKHERLRNLQDILKYSYIQTIEVQEGEEEDQEIELI